MEMTEVDRSCRDGRGEVNIETYSKGHEHKLTQK